MEGAFELPAARAMKKDPTHRMQRTSARTAPSSATASGSWPTEADRRKSAGRRSTGGIGSRWHSSGWQRSQWICSPTRRPRSSCRSGCSFTRWTTRSGSVPPRPMVRGRRLRHQRAIEPTGLIGGIPCEETRARRRLVVTNVVDDALRTQVRNIEAQYGRSMSAWTDLIRARAHEARRDHRVAQVRARDDARQREPGGAHRP